MTRKDEIMMMWQIVNLMHDLQQVLWRLYFDDFLDLEQKEKSEAYRNPWLFPNLPGSG